MICLPELQHSEDILVLGNELQEIEKMNSLLLELPERIENHIQIIQSVSPSKINDSLYKKAVEIVQETRKANISLLQKSLSIGHNRVQYLLEKMEERGIVRRSLDTGLLNTS